MSEQYHSFVSHNGPDLGEGFDSFVRGTLYDAEFMGRYVPLQYWQEYLSGRKILQKYLISAGAAEIIVPVRPEEGVLLLVSLIVWAKVGQVLRDSTQRITVSARQILRGGGKTLDRTGNIARLRSIAQVFGFVDEPDELLNIAKDVDADREVYEVANRLYRKLRNQFAGQLTKEQLTSMLETVTLVAYCALQDGRFILCGQDQAALINSLWNELRHANGEKYGRPVALYIPLMPFTSTYFPVATDPEEVLSQKLAGVLRSFSGRDQQILWVNDLLRLTVGTWPYTLVNKNDAAIEGTDDLTSLVRELARRLHLWFKLLMSRAQELRPGQLMVQEQLSTKL